MATLTPAIAGVECGTERHTIRWETGELWAPDHGDPDAERALAVLGGQSLACLGVLSAWARLRSDPRLLSVLTRGLTDPVQSEAAPPQMRTTARLVGPGSPPGSRRTPFYQSSGPGAAGAPDPSGQEELRLLATLGRDIALRMVATVTAEMLNTTPAAPARPALEASLFGRATSALRLWLGDPTLEVALEVVETGEPCRIEKPSDHQLQVALPLRWVADVWARDLSLVAGRFSLSILDTDAQGVVLETIGSELGPPRPLRVGWP